MTTEHRDAHRSKRRPRLLASAWIALLAVVYAALSPLLAAAVLAERPAALARMLGLPHDVVVANADEEHAGHGAHLAHQPAPAQPDDDAAHYAHGIYCSFCLNAGSTAALLAPPLAHDVAAFVSTASIAPRPRPAAAAVHPYFRSRAPPHFLHALV
jgi:hypothetical protein